MLLGKFFTKGSRGEEGGSLVLTLVAVSLLSFIMIAIGRSAFNVKLSRKNISKTLNYEESESLLITKISQKIYKGLFENCFADYNKNWSLVINNMHWDWRSIIQSADVKAWPEGQSWALDAANRCTSPYQSSDQSKYYFCIRPGISVKPDEIGQPRRNDYGIYPIGIDFLDVPGSFAEITIELKNLYDNTPTTCELFKSNFKSSGFAIMYTFYMPKKDKSGKHKYRRVNGLRMIGGR